VYFCKVLEHQIKNKILTQGKYLFIQNGIRNTNMDDIARHFSISKKTLYLHFKDKNDLIAQIIKNDTEAKEKAVLQIINENNSKNAIESNFAVFNFVLLELSKLPLLIISEMKKYHPEAWQIIYTHKTTFVRETVTENLKKGLNEGLYRKEINPEIVSALYIGALDNLSNENFFSAQHYSYGDLYIEFIIYHLFGIVSPKGYEIVVKLTENLKNKKNVL
jgi:AcrR family transcriptional regulator